MSKYIVERIKLPSQLDYLIRVTPGDRECLSTHAAVRIRGKVDKARFENAVQRVIDENDAMRFVVKRTDDGELYYSVLRQISFEPVYCKLMGETEEEKMNDLASHAEKIYSRADDFIKDKMWDIVLFEMGAEDNILFLRTNHIISDGESNFLIIGKIAAAYNGIEVPRSGSYLEYLEELREFDSSPEGQRLMSNWDEMSRGYKPFITYPTGERKRSGLTHMFTLDIPELAKYAREHRISLFHLNLFCLHASISAVFNTTDTVICIANGIRSGRYASTVGFLTNGTMSRFKIDKNKLMSQLVLECRNNYFNADKNLKMGYRISPCDFQISYQNYAIPPKMMFDHTKAEVITDMRLSHSISWDIMVMAVFEINDKLMFSGGYDEDIYTPEVLEKMKKYYIAAADCLTNNDKTFEEFCKL